MAAPARPYPGRAEAALVRGTPRTADPETPVYSSSVVVPFAAPGKETATVAPELTSVWPDAKPYAVPHTLIGSEAKLEAAATARAAAGETLDDFLQPAPRELNAEEMETILFSFAAGDLKFVDKLQHYLRRAGVRVPDSWHEVPRPLDMTARSLRKWRGEVLERFCSVGTVVLVVSKEWEASPLCQDEFGVLQRSGRVLVPVMRELAKSVPGVLAGLRWVRAETMDVEEAARAVAEYLRGDVDYGRDHTWLSRRAQAWTSGFRKRALALGKKDTLVAESVLWRAARGSQPPVSHAMIDLWKASYGYNVVSSSWHLIAAIWGCVILLALGAVATYFAVSGYTRRC